jgi:hypothetical protein
MDKKITQTICSHSLNDLDVRAQANTDFLAGFC